MPISAKNEIASYLHCRKCIEELPSGESPASYARFEIGLTSVGIQIWCRRHDVNVCHIDFQGQRHPANMQTK